MGLMASFTNMTFVIKEYSTKTSYFTGSILNWGALRLPILHTLTQNEYHDSTIESGINVTQSSCKLTEKCFCCIIRELLNWYWWILALVSFKMHSQVRAFLQPIHANIHQYQFNNLISLAIQETHWCKRQRTAANPTCSLRRKL